MRRRAGPEKGVSDVVLCDTHVRVMVNILPGTASLTSNERAADLCTLGAANPRTDHQGERGIYTKE